ncbi:MAG: leucine-rich repeat protein [Bacteroidales bacterium]|nr:leucine-rich repeat protein [Bacteroidales bacterium]
MMGISKVKTFLISFLVAIFAACLGVALAACSGGGDEKNAGIYGRGEEGVYYYDSATGSEYLMTLQSGVYIISEGGRNGYTGMYTYSDDDAYAITFTADGGTAFYATFADDAMSVSIDGTAYTFLQCIDYTVRFVDGTDVVESQIVRYGRSATPASVGSDSRLFVGWYEDEALTVPYGFDRAVTGDMTLYAYCIDVDLSAANYTVTFISDDGIVLGTAETVNGRVYEFPEEENVLGWWVSETNNQTELTYRYDEGDDIENYPVLTENTNLYLVKDFSGVLGGSVYGDKVTWQASASSVTIAVDGDTVTTGAAGGFFAYPFDGLSTGRHEVTLSAAGYGDETLVYVANRLDRVSKFEISGNYLVYGGVENAEYYFVSVECANESHTTEAIYNGSTLYYDFSNCEMGPEGIKFTVYAYAPGYETSVSETFVYMLVLDTPEVTIDTSADAASWTKIENATGYEVYVNGGYAVTVTGTEYSFKYYEKEASITIAVKAVAPGYYSETSADASYTKDTLKAPEITSVSEYEISWDDVGAVSYELNINGYLIDVGNATTYLLTETDLGHVSDVNTNAISVTAVAATASENSQASDLVYVTDKTMYPALTYSDGTVYWQYALAAKEYYVEYEGAVYGPVTGNNFNVTFSHSGDNVVKVYFENKDREKCYAEITIYAYAVIFDVREKADGVDTIYVAKGDTITLAEPENVEQYYTFGGWYTLPVVEEDPWAESYTAGGVLYADDALFDGKSTLILYAFYTKDKSEITLKVGAGSLTEDGSVRVPVGITDYTLGVPAADDAQYVFYGWYAGTATDSVRYTDENGNGLVAFTSAEGMTLYAQYIKVLSFSLTRYQGEDVIAVSKGEDISRVTSVTVPATGEIDGTTYEIGVLEDNAFQGCSNLTTISLPDTLRYISVINNGYTGGSGSFSASGNITAVNIIPSEGSFERHYYSADGVLFSLDADSGTAELIYYPYGRSDTSYTVPSYVYNAYEYEDVEETTNILRPVTTIAVRAFYNHTELLSVTLPASITEVNSEAFYSCSRLQTVVFEWDENKADGTLVIGANAFRNCMALKSVTLPAWLDDFDTSIFTTCIALESVSIEGVGGSYSSVDGLLCDVAGTTVVYCPEGRTGAVSLGEAGTETANITTVGESAFSGCTLITSVYIGVGVTYIGVSAFSGCTGMQSLTFYSGDANDRKLTISSRAFYGCNNSLLTEVELPARLEYLGESAFGNCSKLTTVRYDSWVGATSEDLSGLQAYAFCTSANSSGERTGYVENLVLGANVPTIDFAAIFGGSSLKSVEIAEGSKSYSTSEDKLLIYNAGKTEMIYCLAAATGVINLDSAVTEIADNAFANCTGITEVVLPDGIKTLGKQAFYCCTALTSINLPEGLIEIGDEAFANCTALTSVTLPKSLEKLGSYSGATLVSMNVFSGCTALASIAVTNGNLNFLSKNGVLYLANNGVATELLYCPMNNSETAVEIPSTVTNIVANSFRDNSTVTKVSFENGEVEGELTIGDSVFQGAQKLETVELPAGLTKIGDSMLSYCDSLVYVSVPYTVTYIGVQAFAYDDALRVVYFEPTPEGKSEVALEFVAGTKLADGGVFAYTSNLYYVNIPDRTTQMSAYMFSYSGIENIVIGAGVETIPDYCFDHAQNLQSVAFGEKDNSNVKLKTINQYAFRYAYGDYTLTLPEGVTTLGNSAFVYADVSEVYLPKTVTSLGNTVFGHNSKLTKIVFDEEANVDFTSNTMFQYMTAMEEFDVPASVTTITKNEFYGCSNLKKINFNTNDTGYSPLASIGDYAFQACGLTSFTFPETDLTREDGGKIKLGTEIFRWCDDLTDITLSNGVQEGLDGALGLSFHVETVNIGTCTAYTVEDNIFYGKNDGTIIKILGDVGKDLVIPYSVTEIGMYAFQYATTIETVKIPTSVAKISDYAFDSCYGLKSVSFYTPTESELGDDKDSYQAAASVTIGSYSFRNCSALASIELPEGVVLGDNGYPFSGCSALEKVVLPSDITSLGTYTFANCTNLKIVTYTGDTDYDESKYEQYLSTGYAKLPSSLASLGDYAFNKTGLITAYVPNVSTIGTNVWRECTTIKTVVFAEGASQMGNFCFYGCTALESIEIPNSFTSFGEHTLQGCSSLTTVVFPETMKSIGMYMFYQDYALTTVNIPNSVTSIGTYTFYQCTSLESITLSSSLTTLDSYVFGGCSALMSVTIPASVTTLKEQTFVNCTALESVTFEDVTSNTMQTTSLPNNYFQGCSSLKSVVLPNKITALGNYVFMDCWSLESFDTTNITSFGSYDFLNCTSLKYFETTANTTSLGMYLFQGCTDLETVVLNGSFTVLSNYIFQGCSSLKSVTIPDTVTYLGTYAFQNCTSLEEITLPRSLTALGSSNTAYAINGAAYTFDGCTSLRKVVFNDSILAVSAYVFRNCTSLKIVTYTSDPNYSSANDDYYLETGYFSLPSSLTSIGNYAFSGAAITSATLPRFTATSGSTNSVGTYVFSGCTELVSVTFDASSTVMGDYMFSGCTSLISVTIPNGVSTLGLYEFKGCTSLVEAIFEGNTTMISEGAFQGCTSLLEMYVSESIETISDYAFDGCTSLSSVVLADTITSIGKYSFRDCEALGTIVLPAFLDSIGDYAFTGSGLTSMKIPEFVTSIGTAAFGGCDSLATLTADASNRYYSTAADGTMLVDASGKLVSVLSVVTGEVTISGDEIVEIGEYAFYGTEGITKITLDGVSVVGGHAFDGLTDLADITLGSATYIGSNAFEGTAITSVEIPASVIEIADYAFYGLSGLTTVTFATGFGLDAIGAYVFAGTGVAEIEIPDSVTDIGEHAFDGSALASVTFAGSCALETIGTYAFANTDLTSFSIPGTVTEVGSYAFYNSNITAITLDSGIETVGDYAFASIEALTSAAINSGADFGTRIFDSCVSLSSVTFAQSLEMGGIPNYMFNGCTALTSVTLPAGITSIGSYAFANTGLTMISIPETVATIDTYAFNGTALTALEIPASVTTIGNYAFQNCMALVTADLSAPAVLSIGNYAFSGCTALTTLTFGADTTLTIGDYAFSGNTAVTSLSLYIANTVSIGNSAFSGWTSAQTITFDAAQYEVDHKLVYIYHESGEAPSEQWKKGSEATLVYADETGENTEP